MGTDEVFQDVFFHVCMLREKKLSRVLLRCFCLQGRVSVVLGTGSAQHETKFFLDSSLISWSTTRHQCRPNLLRPARRLDRRSWSRVCFSCGHFECLDDCIHAEISATVAVRRSTLALRRSGGHVGVVHSKLFACPGVRRSSEHVRRDASCLFGDI